MGARTKGLAWFWFSLQLRLAVLGPVRHAGAVGRGPAVPVVLSGAAGSQQATALRAGHLQPRVPQSGLLACAGSVHGSRRSGWVAWQPVPARAGVGLPVVPGLPPALCQGAGLAGARLSWVAVPFLPLLAKI